MQLPVWLGDFMPGKSIRQALITLPVTSRLLPLWAPLGRREWWATSMMPQRIRLTRWTRCYTCSLRRLALLYLRRAWLGLQKLSVC